MKSNPAIHAYLLLGPLILTGPVLARQEFVLGIFAIIILFVLLEYIPYYRPIRQNKPLIKALVIYILICSLIGALEYFKLISSTLNHTIFFALLIIYFVKYNSFILKLADKKGNDE